MNNKYTQVEKAVNDHIQSLKGHDMVRTDNISDGFHTFGQLYHDRAVLFSVICNTYPEAAYKSKLHDDLTMYEGMFIVGINTVHGQFSYHYPLSYWDMYKVKELAAAPPYDGHTFNDIGRLHSLLDDKKGLVE